jgi:YVTN family beta-propeller protein
VLKQISRRRLLAAAGAAGLVLLAVPASAALGLTGSSSPEARPTPTNSAPGGPKWTAPSQPGARRAAPGYLAYVALAGGYNVSTVDVAAHTILATDIKTDAAQGVAATPDGRKLYVANTGQYDVLVVDAVSHTARTVHVGPYPKDVAVSPDGTKAYVAVTGGDTGDGGADTVAVIDTATDSVVHELRVGTAPRQVVFSRDGARAYVTCDDRVSVIDVRRNRVIDAFRDSAGPQGIAVDPARRTLYVTEPMAGKVAVIDANTGRTRRRIAAGDQPWAVDLTPDGSRAYVTQLNDNTVAVIDTASEKITGEIGVGKLPESVAVTPDGAEAWVGNGFSGSVSVIDVPSGQVIATIVGGTGTKPLDAAPLGIAFAKAP